MADPLSMAASVAAVVTLAIQSARSLNDTVKRYKNRDKTLKRLHDELEDLERILSTLSQAIDGDSSVLSLLTGPVNRCGQICREFEKSMKAFDRTSKTGIRDWAKMEFMRGDINDFMDSVNSYKSTIQIAIGTITMRTSTLSNEVLHNYNEMIEDTTHNLRVHLQRIDKNLALLLNEQAKGAEERIDLTDEKAVTEQCIRICEDASNHMEKLSNREPLAKPSAIDPDAIVQQQFEAEMMTRKALNRNKMEMIAVIVNLQKRLQILTQGETEGTHRDRLRLQEDINIAKQCIEVCNLASGEVSNQKIYTVGEAVADNESDQIVVNTLADLFSVRKASSTNRSAQLIASTTAEAFQQVAHDRYKSRFGASVEKTGNVDAFAANAHSTDLYPIRQGLKESGEASYRKPNPNEMRKRRSEDDSQKTLLYARD